MSKIKAIIFGVDGVLVDSVQAQALAWQAALCAYQSMAPLRTLRSAIGQADQQILAALFHPPLAQKEYKAISGLRQKILRNEFLDLIQPLPLAATLLTHCRAMGLCLAAIGTGTAEEIQTLLSTAGLNELVDRQIPAAPAFPAPCDPIDRALAELHCTPKQALFVGATPYAVAAAQRSGVTSIGLRSGGWEDSQLAGATVLYDDVADLFADFPQFILSAASTSAAQEECYEYARQAV